MSSHPLSRPAVHRPRCDRRRTSDADPRPPGGDRLPHRRALRLRRARRRVRRAAAQARSGALLGATLPLLDGRRARRSSRPPAADRHPDRDRPDDRPRALDHARGRAVERGDARTPRAQVAAEHGIRVGYHNHWWEFGSIGGRPALEVFAEQLLAGGRTRGRHLLGPGRRAGCGAVPSSGSATGLQFIHVKDGPISARRRGAGGGRLGQHAGVGGARGGAAGGARGRARRLLDGDVFDALADSFAFLTAQRGARVTGNGPVGVGVIGAGVISSQYLDNLTTFPDLKVLFIADLDAERAKAQADKYGVPGSGSRRGASGDPRGGDRREPRRSPRRMSRSRRGRSRRASTSGARSRSRSTGRAGIALLARARELGLRVATAPDTFLGRRAADRAAAASATAGSVTRSRRSRCCRGRGRSPGIRIPTSTTCRAAVRCSTWGRTT